MFDEKEPGKPQNWGWTIGIIVVICLFNLTIFIVIRVMLDSENEFEEPLVQGELRQNLTKFLGLFAMSFCFFCWGCFCCMGNCLKWATCCFHRETRDNVTRCWSTFIHHQHNVVEQMQKKSSNIFVTPRRNKVSPQISDDLEEAQMKREKSANESSKQKTYVRFDLNEQRISETDELNSGIQRSPRTRPTHFVAPGQTRRESNQWMEIHKPVIGKSAHEFGHHLNPYHHENFRRHSVASSGNEEGHRSIGVHNIHYYEIPVSLITPSAVAIVDPAFAEAGTDSDDSTSALSPTSISINSPTSAILEPTRQEQVEVIIEGPN